jgi:hypothetical protein
MGQPPFTMSKYANETDLLRDKCAWLERALAEAKADKQDAYERGYRDGRMDGAAGMEGKP